MENIEQIQYIGARYTTKIYENSLDPSSAEWEANVNYEPLTLVTEDNSTYLSRKVVPKTVGKPSENGRYWALTGAYNGQIASLQNQIDNMQDGSVSGSLQNQIDTIKVAYVKTFDKVSDILSADVVTNEVVMSKGYLAANDRGEAFYIVVDNSVDSYAIELNSGKYILPLLSDVLNPKQFGAVADGTTDDSNALQKMFDYAKDFNITNVNFVGISDISFKNVEIDSDVYINFGKSKIHAIPFTDERAYTLFIVNQANAEVVFDGGQFIGNDTTHGYNPTADVSHPAIVVNCATMIKIINGDYRNFNNRNVDYIDPVFVNENPVLFKILDCLETVIENNNMGHIYGEEAIFVMNKDYPRDIINLKFAGNRISLFNTSALDFIGNSCEIYNNKYNYDYDGSIINAFALKLYVHDENSLGTVNNLYDCCEQNEFQSDTVLIENVHCHCAREFADVSARDVTIKNVIIDTVHSQETTVCRFCKGYGGTNIQHPSHGVAELASAMIILDSVDVSQVDGNMRMFLHTDALVNSSPMFVMKNCKTNKSTVASHAHLFVATNCDVFIEGNVIPMRNDDAVADGPAAIVVQSFNAPRRIMIANNVFVNIDPDDAEYIMSINDMFTVVTGNTAIANQNDNYNTYTMTSAFTTSGNQRMA